MSKKNQQKTSSTEAPKEKQYNLKNEETDSIESRQSLIKQYQYLIHVINADIEAYMNFVVCKRVGLKQGEGYKLNDDNKSITVGGEDAEAKTE